MTGVDILAAVEALRVPAAIDLAAIVIGALTGGLLAAREGFAVSGGLSAARPGEVGRQPLGSLLSLQLRLGSPLQIRLGARRAPTCTTDNAVQPKELRVLCPFPAGF